MVVARWCRDYKPWGNRARKSKQSVTRSDLYLCSNFTGTLGVAYNAAYIGFVYTSLGLKGNRGGWWWRECQRRGSWLRLQIEGTQGELWIPSESRREVSSVTSPFCVLLPRGQTNNWFGIRGRRAPVSKQTGATQRQQTGLDLWITLIPSLRLSS